MGSSRVSVIVIAVAFALGCGSNESDSGTGGAGALGGSAGIGAGGASGGSAGASGGTAGMGSGGTSGSAGAGGTAQLCQSACAVTLTCDPTVDTVACQAQCEKEVTGQGYLIQEIALDYFGQFAALTDDTDCYYTKGYWAWQKWTRNASNVDKLSEQSVMDECRTPVSSCMDPAGSTDGYRGYCLMKFYRYNSDTRNQLRTCLQMTCSPSQPWDCIDGLQVKNEPWLAGAKLP